LLGRIIKKEINKTPTIGRGASAPPQVSVIFLKKNGDVCIFCILA